MYYYATVGTPNKRGNAQLTICTWETDGVTGAPIRNQSSHTRHCKKHGERWQGYFLDADKAILNNMAAASAALSAQLKRYRVNEKPFMPNLVFAWSGGHNDDYPGAVINEAERGQKIIERQTTALEVARAKAEKEARERAEVATAAIVAFRIKAQTEE